MNIRKAIEIQQRYSKIELLKYELDFLIALKLSTEALKQRQSEKLSHPNLHFSLLPGETE